MKKIFSIILIFVIIFLHITVYASINSDMKNYRKQNPYSHRILK